MRTQHMIHFLTLLAIFVFMAEVKAQSQEAVDWFNKAVAEKSKQLKIEHYLKAIEVEPDFIQAHMNLGLAYLHTKDNQSAENAFLKANSLNKGQLNDDLKVRIIFNLATAQKRLKKYVECEKTLLLAQKSARKKPMKAQIIFELGRVYQAQNRLQEALVVLKEGRGKFKNNRAFFDNFIKLVEEGILVQRIESEYQNAISAGQLQQAQSAVQRIREINPNHIGIDEKSAYLDSILKSTVKKEYQNDLFELAEKHEKEGNIDLSINTLQVLLQTEPDNSEASTKLQKLKEQYQEEQNNKLIEEEYANGVAALEQRNWTRAIIAFEQVVVADSEYQDAQTNLNKAKRGLESQSTQSILRQFYLAGVSAMENKNLNSALVSFEKITSISPNYKDAAELIQQIKKAGKVRTVNPLLSDEYFTSLYNEALAAINKEDWMQAMLDLEKLKLLAPDDHNILNLYIQAKEKLKTGSQTAPALPQKIMPLFYVGAAVTVLLIPLLGFTVFSAASRARFYYLRNNYHKAARLYEKLLVKNPERLKYYPILANIYLVLGKNDERAFKVFRMVIDLNLASNIHGQINTILSQKFLSGATTNDNEAIATLENELKSIEGDIAEESNDNTPDTI